jgi:hypothetical protein
MIWDTPHFATCQGAILEQRALDRQIAYRIVP